MEVCQLTTTFHRLPRRRFASWLVTLSVLFSCSHEFAGQLNAAPFVPVRDAHCVAISPDGRLVAIGISGQSNSEFPPRPHPSPRKAGVVQIYETSTRKRLRRMETFGDITKLAFSPDGTCLAMSRLFTADGGIELNEVVVWDTDTGQSRYRFDRCHAFSFVPNKNEILVVSRKRCVSYELSSGQKGRQFPELADAFAIAHDANGATVFGIVSATGGFCIRSCIASTGVLGAESAVMADPFFTLATSRDASAIASGHRAGTVLIWDARTLQPIKRLTTGGAGRAFPFYSPAGDLIAAADQVNSDVVVWEAGTGHEVARYTFKQGSLHTYGLKSEQRTIRPEEDPARFVFGPDGETFLGGPYGGILRLVRGGRDIARFGE